MQEALNTLAPKIGTSVRKCCPSNAQNTFREPEASILGSEIVAMRFSCLAAQIIHYYKCITDRLRFWWRQILHVWIWICILTEQKSTYYDARVLRIVRGNSSVGTMLSLLETRPRARLRPDSSPRNALFERKMSYPKCSGEPFVALKPSSPRVQRPFASEQHTLLVLRG